MPVNIQNGGTNKAIAGVVILYNPESDITGNITTYYKQVDYLYIIDNSPVKTDNLTDFISSNCNTVEYNFMGTNIGIAAALNFAATKAISSGYKYLLTMDQDSTACGGMVELLLETFNQYPGTGIISPLHSNKFDTHLAKKNGIYEVSSVMASGNILLLKAYTTAGKFREDFFIDYVDIEYCIRLKANNYKIFQNSNVVLQHNEANITQKRFLNKVYFPPNNAPFRLYYKTRNLLALRKLYAVTYPSLIKLEVQVFFKNLVKIILFEKQKLAKLRMMILGILDYSIGKMGRKF